MSSGAKSAISEQIHILSHFIGQLTCSERNNLAWTAKISSKAQHHHAQVLSTVVAGAAPRQEVMRHPTMRDDKPSTKTLVPSIAASRARRHRGRSSEAEERHGSRRAFDNTKGCRCAHYFYSIVLPQQYALQICPTAVTCLLRLFPT
jgi:hypothetical protein